MLFKNDGFLLELTKLFQQQRVKNSGSLSLTMKRYDGRTKPPAKLTKKQRLEQKKSSASSGTTHAASTASSSHDSVEYKCLVRAVYGSKKLSTIVSAKDINSFQLAYSNLLKANMDTLKKKVKESKTTTGSTTSNITPSGSTNPNSNTPSSPSTSQQQQQKKTPTTPAKKK